MPEQSQEVRDDIMLGSGEIYCVTFTGTLPADEEIETPDNLLGAISGGASVNYKATYYTAKDDSGTYQKKILTDEDATMKSGILTWKATTLEKICSTAKVTETATRRTVKIGGMGNYDDRSYVLRFVHKEGGIPDVRLTINGTNEAGFELAFTKNKETVLDAEFKALPIDKQGTLIIYEEMLIPGEEPEEIPEVPEED
jgi:hypothetical protein